MHIEPATQMSSQGPIRAFRAPLGGGAATIDVLAWIEGDRLVVKELSSLVRPTRGERHLNIDAIRDVELCSSVGGGEQLLVLRSEEMVVRLQGSEAVVQSLVHELEEVADLGAIAAAGGRPGLMHRLVSWLHGQ